MQNNNIIINKEVDKMADKTEKTVKRISKEDRDKMFLDYIAGYTHAQLTEKYNITHYNLCKIIQRNGWVEKKKTTKKVQLANLEVTFVDGHDQLIDVYFRDLYTMLNIIQLQLHTAPERAFLDRYGNFSYNKFQMAVDTYARLMQTLDSITGGGFTAKDVEDLKLKYEQLDLKKLLAGLSLDDATADNFMEVLAESFAKLNE